MMDARLGKRNGRAGQGRAAAKNQAGKKLAVGTGKGAGKKPKTKTLTRKISDLRQIIAPAARPTAAAKQSVSQKKSAIKQRLGLQSKSARERRAAAANTSSGTKRKSPASALVSSHLLACAYVHGT